MEICRLCCVEKSDEELVTSLSDKIGIITFKDLFEYFSRCTLEVGDALPQRVCRTCKLSLVKFSEFVYIVEQNQLERFKPVVDLNQEQPSIEPDVNENFQDGKDAKKQKLDDSLLEELPVAPETTSAVTRTEKRERRISIFEGAIQSLKHDSQAS